MKKLLALSLLLSLFACSSMEDLVEPAELAPESSVKPGINDSFLNPELKVETFLPRFEGESREVFAQREAIVAALPIELGDTVADIGSGTGAFLGPLAQAIGPAFGGGKLYAVDIAPTFVEHLAQRATDEGLDIVEARLCSERSVDLPKHSIDVAFICDVYHHFEFPRSTLKSLHQALRPGGQVVIVDFERIPGASSEWILGHVRASKEEVIAEMESFNFKFVEELEIPGLEDNYVARFRRR